MEAKKKKRSKEELDKFRVGYKEFWNNKMNNVVITQLLDGKVYLNENGFWCRKCSKCNKEIIHTRKDNAIDSAKKNRNCFDCCPTSNWRPPNPSFEPVEGVYFCQKKLWCRKCPNCNQEIEYTSRYCAITAQKKKSVCYGCYSTALESPKEKTFLDYFNIKERQTKIGPYLVDAIKGNTVYEFLGDFWHGNPKLFKENDVNKTNGKAFGKLYNDTVRRFKVIQDLGYEVKYIWESDWDQFEKDRLLNNSIFKRFNGVDLL